MWLRGATEEQGECLPLIAFISPPTLCFALQPLPEPEYNSDPETVGYRLRVWRTDGQGEDMSEDVEGPAEAREAAIEGLNPWTRYQVQIQARNSIGPGPWSNTVHARTAESGKHTRTSRRNVLLDTSALTPRQAKLLSHLINPPSLPSHSLVSERQENGWTND